MTSGITYDGVESAEGGNIFQGLSFWVAQRVPMRNDLLSKIKSNGGTVVPLEKSAKFLIADHARKDAPPGSYSWKFITDSVEHGALQVEDRYRIGPDPNQPRPVGSGGGSKRAGRVPFTHADEAALAKWVLSRPELSRKGNELYMQWEKLNPRHTWQSWRDRWVKKLEHLDHHQLKMLAKTAPSEASSQEPLVERAETIKPTTAAIRQHQPVPQHAAPAAPPQGGRMAFTPADDAIIARWAVENSLVVGTNLFKDIEQEHPHHSWESWRNRWNKKLRLYPLDTLQRMATTDSEDAMASEADPSTELKVDQSGATASSRREETAPEGAGGVSTPMMQKTRASEGRSATKETTQRPVATPMPQRQKDSAATEPVTSQPGETNEKSNRQQGDRDHSEDDGAPEGELLAVMNDAEAGEAPSEGGEDAEEDDDPQRDQFYRDLISFNDCTPETFVWPVLSGPTEDYEIDLYELAQAYDAQGVALDDVDWAGVARELGWEPAEETWVSAALEECFDARLTEFLQAMNDYDPELNEAEVEDEPQEQEAGDATMRSSPPVRHESPKRRLEADYISSASSIRKRRRIRDAEIPSTPDEQVGLSRELRQKHGMSVSPSVRRDSTQTSQQLPPAQGTPIRSRAREATSLRPLDLDEDMEGVGGGREQDTSSDEEIPSLNNILRNNGNARTAKAPKRTLPAAFRGPLTQPRRPPQPSATPEAQSPSEQVAESHPENVSGWLSRHLRTGYPIHILKLALHHTSYIPGPSADHVVDSLSNENGIPTDIPGVWLPDEDRTIKQLITTDLSKQATSAKELKEQKRLREEQRRLIGRHGWEGLSKRKKFLRDNDELKRKSSGEEGKKDMGGKLTDEEKKRRQTELQRLMED